MRAARSLALGLTLVIAASGCTTPEPTLKEAAAELQKDTHLLETDDVFKNPLKKLRIIQRPDKDIPCDKDKFKRVLQATADDEVNSPDMDSHLDMAEELISGTLTQRMEYKREPPFTVNDNDIGRFVYAAKRDKSIVIAVYIAPESPTWRLQAETSCLAR